MNPASSIAKIIVFEACLVAIIYMISWLECISPQGRKVHAEHNWPDFGLKWFANKQEVHAWKEHGKSNKFSTYLEDTDEPDRAARMRAFKDADHAYMTSKPINCEKSALTSVVLAYIPVFLLVHIVVCVCYVVFNNRPWRFDRMYWLLCALIAVLLVVYLYQEYKGIQFGSPYYLHTAMYIFIPLAIIPLFFT